MRVDLKAAPRCALVLLLMPLACAADGVLRGTLPGGRANADPPEMQVTTLPSGALMKRMPGQRIPSDPAAAPSAREARLGAGVSVQQSGAAQLQVMAGSTPPAVAARPAGLTVRQLGGAQLLEVPGQRSPVLAVDGVAAAAPLPAGVRVVELAADEPLPLNPQPNTLYRRRP